MPACQRTPCIPTLEGCDAASRALVALGLQLEALSGPLAVALHAANDASSRNLLNALVVNSCQLLGAWWRLVADIGLPRKPLLQLARSLRLATRAGPAAITWLLQSQMPGTGMLRHATSQLLMAYAGTMAQCSDTVSEGSLLEAVPVEESIALVKAVNALFKTGELMG